MGLSSIMLQLRWCCGCGRHTSLRQLDLASTCPAGPRSWSVVVGLAVWTFTDTVTSSGTCSSSQRWLGGTISLPGYLCKVQPCARCKGPMFKTHCSFLLPNTASAHHLLIIILKQFSNFLCYHGSLKLIF